MRLRKLSAEGWVVVMARALPVSRESFAWTDGRPVDGGGVLLAVAGRRAGSWQRPGGVEVEVELEHVDPWLAEHPPLPPLGVALHQLAHHLFGHASLAGDARH